MLAREALTEAVRLGVDDEIDIALPMQRDILAAVSGGGGKAQPLEQSTQQHGIFGGVFDELEPVGAERVETLLGGAAHTHPLLRN